MNNLVSVGIVFDSGITKPKTGTYCLLNRWWCTPLRKIETSSEEFAVTLKSIKEAVEQFFKNGYESKSTLPRQVACITIHGFSIKFGSPEPILIHEYDCWIN